MPNSSAITYEQREQMKVDEYNAQIGDLAFCDCKLCKNKGYIAKLNRYKDKELEQCNCIAERKTRKQAADSGINKCYSFDNFKVTQPWQKSLLENVKAYAANPTGWLFIGGQVGAGKTHLCSAVFMDLISKGQEGHYMLWTDTVQALKACVNDVGEYDRLMKPLQTVKVLYIDDFFKANEGGRPTAADILTAFRIINNRYNNPELLTIISSEYFINEIKNLDEAVGSRIYERVGEHGNVIKKEEFRNYRLRGNKK